MQDPISQLRIINIATADDNTNRLLLPLKYVSSEANASGKYSNRAGILLDGLSSPRDGMLSHSTTIAGPLSPRSPLRISSHRSLLSRSNLDVSSDSPRGNVRLHSPKAHHEIVHEKVSEWIRRCLPEVDWSSCQRKVSSIASPKESLCAMPVILLCSPFLKLRQNKTRELGRKRRLMVGTRDDLMIFRDDGMLKLRQSWSAFDSVITFQLPPIHKKTIEEYQINQLAASLTSTKFAVTCHDSSDFVNLSDLVNPIGIILQALKPARDVAMVFFDYTTVHQLISVLINRKRHLSVTMRETLVHHLGPLSDQDLSVLMRDRGIILGRDHSASEAQTIAPTMPLISRADNVKGDSAIILEAISELNVNAKKCLEENTATAQKLHLEMTKRYADALNNVISRKNEMDVLAIRLHQIRNENRRRRDTLQKEIAQASNEVQTVSVNLLESRSLRQTKINESRKQCMSIEERTKQIVEDINRDDAISSSRCQELIDQRVTLEQRHEELKSEYEYAVRNLETNESVEKAEKELEGLLQERENFRGYLENIVISLKMRLHRCEDGMEFTGENGKLVYTVPEDISDIIERGPTAIPTKQQLKLLEERASEAIESRRLIEIHVREAEHALKETQNQIALSTKCNEAQVEKLAKITQAQHELMVEKDRLLSELEDLQTRVDLIPLEKLVCDDLRREALIEQSITTSLADNSIDNSITPVRQALLALSSSLGHSAYATPRPERISNGSLIQIRERRGDRGDYRHNQLMSTNEGDVVATQLNHLKEVRDRLYRTVASIDR